ncbi:hypothetical protein L208DRAFT_1396836 [Tricholoma matsutake]|nr:hypothetical protein L208DRAFT_1396836 [Tricholoma matsutake 945]
MTYLPTTYGSILLGASFAYGLTGCLCLQCASYFKLYSEDRYMIKILVTVVLVLDLTHTSFICASLFHYFLTHFGDRDMIGQIPWSIAFTVVVTAIQTFIAHCFFAHRILKASRGNWYITGPIICLAFGRLLAASVSTAEMLRVHTYSAFIQKYPGWIFTLGLSLSSGTEIIITGWQLYFLRNLRGLTGSNLMIQAIDLLIRYTLETGALTCIATTVSLICWLSMPKNLVFLGLHFIIAKLYANSLLAALNTRRELRGLRSKSTSLWMHPASPTVMLNQRSAIGNEGLSADGYSKSSSKVGQMEFGAFGAND